MEQHTPHPTESTPPIIFIVTGGLGALGEQLTHVLLAQFPNAIASVKVFPRTLYPHQVEQVVTEAESANATIVHTLSDSEIRQVMIKLADEKNIPAFDVVGPLLEHFSRCFRQEPLGRPGLFQQLYPSYYKRVEAIEFTLALDDGVNYNRWHEAEIVLVGVSRVGKTPLSLYLSILGWKVANIPLVPGLPPRPKIYQIDKRRVVGLTIDPTRLLNHRRHRQEYLGVSGGEIYVDPVKIYEELEEAQKMMRRAGFKVIDVTDKPIENTAHEVLTLVSRRLKSEPEAKPA
jgi:hypothetical protein